MAGANNGADDWITPARGAPSWDDTAPSWDSTVPADDWIKPPTPDEGTMHAIGHGLASGATFGFSDEALGI